MVETILSVRNAKLAFGSKILWSELDLQLFAGQFLAILGPNGCGKSSLLKCILGLQNLSKGNINICGKPGKLGNKSVGYIPQQKSFYNNIGLRVKDIVAMGIDGHRWGIRIKNISKINRRVSDLLELVGIEQYANTPISFLSGGQQQRVRIAQALATDPKLLLCDEALLSLDLHNQQVISALVSEQCKTKGTSVVFVTHEINPIIEYVDYVLYLVDGRFTVGTPKQVMRSEVLSKLYKTNIEVVSSGGRIIVVGAPETFHGSQGH